MIEIWDYFMRRKGLLLLLLAIFLTSGSLSYRALHSSYPISPIENQVAEHSTDNILSAESTSPTNPEPLNQLSQLDQSAQLAQPQDIESDTTTELNDADSVEVPLTGEVEKASTTTFAVLSPNYIPQIPSNTINSVSEPDNSEWIHIDIDDSSEMVDPDPTIEELIRFGSSDDSDIMILDSISTVEPSYRMSLGDILYYLLLWVSGVMITILCVYLVFQHFFR